MERTSLAPRGSAAQRVNAGAPGQLSGGRDTASGVNRLRAPAGSQVVGTPEFDDVAELLAAGGRRDNARELLETIYNWFTKVNEGLETHDLKAARALLDELPKSSA